MLSRIRDWANRQSVNSPQKARIKDENTPSSAACTLDNQNASYVCADLFLPVPLVLLSHVPPLTIYTCGDSTIQRAQAISPYLLMLDSPFSESHATLTGAHKSSHIRRQCDLSVEGMESVDYPI